MEIESDWATLLSFGARGDVANELLRYCQYAFQAKQQIEHPVPDAPQIAFYESYLQESKEKGVFETLQQHLAQLQFPVTKGLSQSQEYKDVTLRGKAKQGRFELNLKYPQGLDLWIHHDDLVGKIPVLVVENRQDFVTLVCALSNKNEPRDLPESMGAAFLNGLNNWSRIQELKKEWLIQNPMGSWSQHFKQNVIPHRELYQDQLILLSKQPYSNLPAQALGLESEPWLSHSLRLRLAHECAHLFTLRQYGQMAIHLFDELIADYAGITYVLDQFDLNWFFHFMGMENYPSYREGGRFQNYLTDLSPEATNILQAIIISAAKQISNFEASLGPSKNSLDRLGRMKAICETGLLPLASNRGEQALIDHYEHNRLAVS